jgi:hypothetical protein
MIVAMEFMLFSILAIDNLTPEQTMLISNTVNHIITYIIVALLVSCFLNLFYAAWLSNRIVGPLIRLKNFMDTFVPGRVHARLAFRKKDLFPELASSFNALQAGWRRFA